MKGWEPERRGVFQFFVWGGDGSLLSMGCGLGMGSFMGSFGAVNRFPIGDITGRF